MMTALKVDDVWEKENAPIKMVSIYTTILALYFVHDQIGGNYGAHLFMTKSNPLCVSVNVRCITVSRFVYA